MNQTDSLFLPAAYNLKHDTYTTGSTLRPSTDRLWVTNDPSTTKVALNPASHLDISGTRFLHSLVEEGDEYLGDDARKDRSEIQVERIMQNGLTYSFSFDFKIINDPVDTSSTVVVSDADFLNLFQLRNSGGPTTSDDSVPPVTVRIYQGDKFEVNYKWKNPVTGDPDENNVVLLSFDGLEANVVYSLFLEVNFPDQASSSWLIDSSLKEGTAFKAGGTHTKTTTIADNPDKYFSYYEPLGPFPQIGVYRGDAIGVGPEKSFQAEYRDISVTYPDGVNTLAITTPGITTQTNTGTFLLRDNVTGSAGNDTINGGHKNDTVDGGNGNDSILGFTGEDSIRGGSVKDTLNGGTDNDILKGDAGNDKLYGGSGDDDLFGGTGNDYLTGNEGADTLRGDAGNDNIASTDSVGDVINAGSGNDTVSGGVGNDLIFGFSGYDQLSGNNGDDTITSGSDGNGDTVFGGNGNDSITGGGGFNDLYGNNGNDTINGGAGSEEIFGGSGNDHISGGAGADMFVFTGTFGDDTIADFNLSTANEKVNLGGVSSITSFSDLVANHTENVAGNLVITDFGGNTITLIGIQEHQLSASDFIF